MSDEKEYLSEEEVRALEERVAKKAEKWHAANKAEAMRLGKEPFDLDKLIGYMKYPPLPEDVTEFREIITKSQERQYYADKDVMTLKEFAEFLDRTFLQGF